jgi:hypothetical protein
MPMRKSQSLGGVLLALLILNAVALRADDKAGGDAKTDEGTWTPLWDGKTLAGWHKIGQGEWTIEDGAIVGRNKPANEYGHLVSDKAYKDFTIRLKYKAIAGNSGLYFRIKEEGFSGVSGFQAEIDPQRDAGGLYETNGRGWVVHPTPEDVAKWYKPGEWNEMAVSAKGGDVVVHVNGMKSAELKGDQGKWNGEGHFALQIHGGQDVHVMFKDIEILQGEAGKKGDK